jgi:hypothetical protein
MKRMILLLSMFYIASSSIIAQDIKVEEVTSKATISFSSIVYDYGEIEYLGNGECSFEFTNTGTETLVISNVQASCGCTVPKWSKDPIKPGEKGTITVKYNTRIPGNFSKSIRVHSNAEPSQVVLRIKGSVKQKEQIEQK